MNAGGKFAGGEGMAGSGAGTAGSNAITSATGYTYSPSSTFQMAGNEQIQGKFETCQFELEKTDDLTLNLYRSQSV